MAMGWIWQRKENQAREGVLEPLSDRQYNSLLLSLLQEVTPAQVQARLGERQHDVYVDQGNEAFFRGDFGGAIASYDEASRINPDKHEALAA
jgi:hypothetical protein